MDSSFVVHNFSYSFYHTQTKFILCESLVSGVLVSGAHVMSYQVFCMAKIFAEFDV